MIPGSRAGLPILSLVASAATTVAAPRPATVPPPSSSSADSSIGSDADDLLAVAPPQQQQQQQRPPPLLLKRQQELNNDTLNGLVDGSPCQALTVVFARGTLESGNVGSFAGPPFFQALASRVGAVNMSVQGVDYPAVSEGFFSGGDPGGSQTM